MQARAEDAERKVAGVLEEIAMARSGLVRVPIFNRVRTGPG